MQNQSGWESFPPETGNLFRCLREGGDVICTFPKSPFIIMAVIGIFLTFSIGYYYWQRLDPVWSVKLRLLVGSTLLAISLPVLWRLA
ncbi:hypothetical protein ACSHT0_17395 [Tepidicaulis sp. LMO-SS28]|uniref:hypothetical protein n=1 Tax=Tepidicaulis sp. LMO-SS28 TaxID=3447455 RepID=UPI003EE16467